MRQSSPIAKQVYDALGTYLRRDPLSFHPDDSLRDDLALDSLMTIELVYEIEMAFDLQIPDEDFVELPTIQHVIHYLERRTRPSSSHKRAASKKLKKGSPSPQRKIGAKRKRHLCLDQHDEASWYFNR